MPHLRRIVAALRESWKTSEPCAPGLATSLVRTLSDRGELEPGVIISVHTPEAMNAIG